MSIRLNINRKFTKHLLNLPNIYCCDPFGPFKRWQGPIIYFGSKRDKIMYNIKYVPKQSFDNYTLVITSAIRDRSEDLKNLMSGNRLHKL